MSFRAPNRARALVGGALLALLGVVIFAWKRSAGPTETSSERSSLVTEPSLHRKVDSSKSPERSPTKQDQLAGAVAANTISVQPDGAARYSQGTHSISQSGSDLIPGSDASAVDRPSARRVFPVSPSIEAQCATHPIPNREECDDVEDYLRKMMLQSRDETWASTTEAKLRDYATQISNDMQIRALECRETLCAMEVATVTGNLDLLPWREVAALGVDDRSHFIMGYESDQSGVQEKIVLRIYERR